jgi:hypothetical protein
MITHPWKAPFMRWFEQDFSGSFNVRMLPALARLMYRSLLQAAWHSDNPPYAPNDDAVLMLMADAPSPEDWVAHRQAIMNRLQVTENGKWLYHPKAVQEYERAGSEHDRKSSGPKRRWQSENQEDEVPTGDKDAKPDAALVETLEDVWAFYMEEIERNPQTYGFTTIRKRKGMARLRECLKKTGDDLDKAVGLMKLAIERLVASDWHMGRDPKSNGKKYCDWESHLFKSYEQMEKWWNQ